MVDRDAQHPATDAVRACWTRHYSRPDEGGAVSIRQAWQPIMQFITDDLVRAGVDADSIHTELRKSLPSAYSPSGKLWDLVVLDNGVPIAAMEIVFQSGTGAGPNFRNRISEAVADSIGLLQSYRRSTVAHLTPFIGRMFVLEETTETTKPRRWPHQLLEDPAATTAPQSVLDRYTSAFRELIGDGTYSNICYLTFDRKNDGFVREPCPDMGYRKFIQSAADRIAQLRKLNKESSVSAVEFGRLLAQRDDIADVVSGLVSTPEGLSAAEAAVINQRRKTVAALQKLALDGGSNETTMQKALKDLYWVFGGQYVGIAERRDLMPLDQHDIPLVCADGSLQIVELKGPECKVVERHRNHFIVSSEVHKAVGQCMNYLRTMDETGMGLQTVHENDLGISYDYRRAGGIVVIGHPGRKGSTEIERKQVEQTIRSYNSHLSRVQVLTYADLLDSAERALGVGGQP
ncbi:Shedu anti-phage system protein SduA domain-containing protein [Streptomyces luteoverticillatus]|nr:Shedu anti-phage system protein SduA domain-containing protein [Streptomyces luteoverticillatus]